MKELKDLDLWREYTKSIQKIKDKNIVTPKIKQVNYQFKDISNNKKNEEVVFLNNMRSFKDVETIELNKKERRKFKSEATIDLHGYTREIDSALEMFCAKCIINNVRNITVITGKGAGIVKGSVLNWLKKHSEFVIGFFEIKDSKGESGAFALKLRSK